MKRKLLALAVGATIASPSMAMDREDNFYGRLNLSVELVNIDKDDDSLTQDSGSNWEMRTNTSVFGFKGYHAISDSVKGIYQIEWGVGADGSAEDLAIRNRYAGVVGGFGLLKAGRMDTPLKNTRTIDLFAVQKDAWVGNVIPGGNRVSDQIWYSTPTFGGGLVATVSLLLNEENEAVAPCKGPDGADDCRDGLADSYSTSLVYKANGITLAAGYENDTLQFANAGSIGNNRASIIRLVGQYKTDLFSAGLLYGMASVDKDENGGNAIDENSIVISGSYNVGSAILKAQYITTTGETEVAGASDEEKVVTQYTFGADFPVTKLCKSYVFYNGRSTDNDTGGDPSKSKLVAGFQLSF